MNPSRKLEVSTSKIINAIKVRPALYNKKDPEYYTMNRFKGKLWKDVCREVFSNWDQLKPQQKVEFDYDLRKRWKNIRTCFTRELAAQKKEKGDSTHVRLRKRYSYFDQLTFLLNPDATKPSDSDFSQSGTILEDSDDDSDEDPLEAEELEDVIVKPEVLEIEQYGAEGTQEHYVERRPGVVFQEKIVGVMDDMKRDEEDEDKQFMLSLVPSIRKLTDRKKFEAKIAILNVIKDITFQE